MPDLFEGAYGDNDRAVPVLEHDERLFQVESHKIPATRLMGQDNETGTNSLIDWEMETDGIIPLAGVKDGQDVTDFTSQGQDSLESYIGHLRESWMVTKVAGKVKSAGIKNQRAHQRMKALERLRMKLERVICSGIEMQRGSKTKEYRTRGAMAWLVPDLQTLAGKGVPVAYQPPGASIYTGSLDDFTDDNFETMLNAAAEQKQDGLDLTGMVGLTLKSLMSGWTQKVDYGNSTTEPLLQFTLPASEKRMLKMVNTFEFDAGVVEVMLNHNLCYGIDGAKSDYSSRSGMFLDLPVWKKRYMQHVSEFDLPDGGGGPRGFADVLMGLRCGMPGGQLAVYSNTGG